MTSFNLAGRNAIITGGGSGLGRSFAHALAGAGANVACVDWDAAGGEETVARIRASGGAATFLHADVADHASVEAMMARFVDTFGHCDILVNNAGIATPPARTHEVAVADWDRLMSINLRGVFLCTRAALPLMFGSSHASIINLGSFIGLVGVYPGFPISGIAYASSKAAIVGFTKQVALEYAKDGIRVNAIAPGWHGGTKLGRERRAGASADDIARFEQHIASSVPMGRRGLPSELDGLVLYLASDLSSYVTGQVFAHDGGLTAA